MLRPNIYRGKCLVCGRQVAANEGFRRFVRGRGYRVFCTRHADSLESYHGSEALRAEYVGTPKKTALARQTLGMEVETDGDSRQDAVYLRFRGTLERVGFVFESDCTVHTGEAPSPVMRGLATASAIFRNNQDVMEMLFTNRTGLHIHTYSSKMQYLRRYYHSVFLPFAEWLNSRGAEWREEKIGSDWRGYAEMIDKYSDPLDHSNVVNMQHSNTIEFRLPRVREYHQIMMVLKAWRAVGLFLEEFDFHEDADSNIRLAYAKKAGEGVRNTFRDFKDNVTHEMPFC